MTETQTLKVELVQAKAVILGLRLAVAQVQHEHGKTLIEMERQRVEAEVLKDAPEGSTFDWNTLSVKPSGG